ncbi:MAG: hypothetical protein N2517_07335 [Ignavibacteria bacterium]|nr:hypothetical protein [Ignavibacteria bacterium]
MSKEGDNIDKDCVDNLKQLLKPIENIQFSEVIKAIFNHDVLSFDDNNNEHKEVLKKLIECAKNAGEEINKIGILRPRPNEVGNDVEQYVKNELEILGLNPQIPSTNKEKRKAIGYPDIIFY